MRISDWMKKSRMTKKIDRAQAIFDKFFQAAEKNLDENNKNLDELNKHLIDIVEYKRP
jgi:hypothetical protein